MSILLHTKSIREGHEMSQYKNLSRQGLYIFYGLSIRNAREAAVKAWRVGPGQKRRELISAGKEALSLARAVREELKTRKPDGSMDFFPSKRMWKQLSQSIRCDPPMSHPIS
jgi:hypothetical protein